MWALPSEAALEELYKAPFNGASLGRFSNMLRESLKDVYCQVLLILGVNTNVGVSATVIVRGQSNCEYVLGSVSV